MHADPSRAAAIELSLEVAAERSGDLTPIVYARLFERNPAMRALFLRDKNDAIKGEMLMRAFEAILDFVGPRRYADHLIQNEVGTHAGYDVPPDVFATFFRLVAEIVEEACGAEWSPAMADAWGVTLGELDRYVTHPYQDLA